MSYSFGSSDINQNSNNSGNSNNGSNQSSRLDNYVEASYLTENQPQQQQQQQQTYQQISGSYSASIQPSMYTNSHMIASAITPSSRTQSQMDIMPSSASLYSQQHSSYHEQQQQPSTTYLSSVEAAILRSAVPIDLQPSDADEVINAGGHRGIWLNKAEVENWRGTLPISAYAINEDAAPEIITKRTQQNLTYIQGEEYLEKLKKFGLKFQI